MNIQIVSSTPYVLQKLENHFVLSSTQKKVIAFAGAYFCLAALCYTIYRSCMKAKNETKIDIRQPAGAVKTVLKRTEGAPSFGRVHIKDEKKIPADCPEFPKADPNQQIQPQHAQPFLDPMRSYLDQAQKRDDFLSMLRCLKDHPDWVSANIDSTIQIIQPYVSRFDLLKPLKVVGDLYESLLEEHPLLRTSTILRNAEIVFENQVRYRTHLIVALKNFHQVRSLFEKELKQKASQAGIVEIHLPVNPKEFKAIFEYLDRSNPLAISKIDFLRLVTIGNQYASPSLLRYCEEHIRNGIPKFSHKNPNFAHSKPNAAQWSETIEPYGALNPKNIHFIIDDLLSQIMEFDMDEMEILSFLDSLEFKGLDQKRSFAFKNELKSRLKVILTKGDAVREEHDDRICDSIDLLDKLALRLESPLKSTDYLSCSSTVKALSTLFKAAIANQLKDDPHLPQIKENLSSLCRQKKLHDPSIWGSLEWDPEKARCISSLAVCLHNYLHDQIPDDLASLPHWHHESLVLAFNENDSESTPMHETVVRFAENAVKKRQPIGFRYLFRPSSSRTPEKGRYIFTVTYLIRSSMNSHPTISNHRIEAALDPKTNEWLYKSLNSNDSGLPLDAYIKKLSGGNLKIFPVPTPKTRERRVSAYVHLTDGFTDELT